MIQNFYKKRFIALKNVYKQANHYKMCNHWWDAIEQMIDEVRVRNGRTGKLTSEDEAVLSSQDDYKYGFHDDVKSIIIE